MFLLRSAFWLTAAFLVMKPGFDLHGAAQTLSDEAMVRGTQFIADQVATLDCETNLTCHGGKAVLSAALPPLPAPIAEVPEVVAPVAVAPLDPAIPYPRPRPHWAV